ncbi:MAG: hypothetical protein U5K31_02770 [Balneolaceae bacterium]|nr:hypothetical protein [Balneolaceae bacterium]
MPSGFQSDHQGVGAESDAHSVPDTQVVRGIFLELPELQDPG